VLCVLCHNPSRVVFLCLHAAVWFNKLSRSDNLTPNYVIITAKGLQKAMIVRRNRRRKVKTVNFPLFSLLFFGSG